MSDVGSQQDSRDPRKSGPRTIAEESRERWTPEHPDVKEAGDDGPHGPVSESVTSTTGDDSTEHGIS
jgi:hypothetical protein